MIKTRMIPTLLYKDYTLVKGVSFNSWRRVGSVMQAVKVYNMREVDELIFYDVTANQEGCSPDFEHVDQFADECFMPLTVGGGVRMVEDIRRLLLCGADKVALNTILFETPEILTEGAHLFGAQCLVAVIDVKKNDRGDYVLMSHSATQEKAGDLVTYAQKLESLGAGEIVISSVDRDGTLDGYDIDLISMIARSVAIPVIASGGAGCPEDAYKAIAEGHAHAVAAASMFHFTEVTPLEVKKHLVDKGIPVRL